MTKEDELIQRSFIGIRNEPLKDTGVKKTIEYAEKKLRKETGNWLKREPDLDKYLVTLEELGDLIDITEDMCFGDKSMTELGVFSRKRTDLINRIRLRPGREQADILEALRGTSDTRLEDFLDWLADRLVYIYHENPNVDFVQSLRHRANTARKLRNYKKMEVEQYGHV